MKPSAPSSGDQEGSPPGLDPDVFLELSRLVVELGGAEGAEALLRTAIERNRLFREGLLALALLELSRNRHAEAWIAFSEAARARPVPLPEPLEALRSSLETPVLLQDPAVRRYHSVTGEEKPVSRLNERLRIFIYTNLFPPQELGGFGRKMWSFAASLVRRGHTVRILTADAPAFQKKPDPTEMDLEPLVSRTLKLYGTWENGRTTLTAPECEMARIIAHNMMDAARAVEAFQPDICLMGNLDFIGPFALKEFLAAGLPVFHLMGNTRPGYPPEFTPAVPHYRLGPCSAWLGNYIVEEEGYPGLRQHSVIYPGASTERFHCAFPADCGKLRIAYAGLLMPYKGPQILMAALVGLQKAGVPFSCTFAGDTTDAAFLHQMQQVALDHGISECVHFPGYLDRQGLRQLYAASNAMVFPSQVDEGFGISQVEAMASGLVLLSSGTGGSREVLRDGVDGFFFRKDNPEELAARLAWLYQNPEEFRKMGVAAGQRALEFSVEASTDRIEGVFAELLDAAKTRQQRARGG